MPPKKKSWRSLVPSTVAEHWISPNPNNSHNWHGYNTANLSHHSNLIDYGFNHLNLPAAVPTPADPIMIEEPTFKNKPTEELKYLATVQEKFAMVKAFILKEKELGLDPNRSMDNDITAQALQQRPIVFTMRAQQLVRNIIDEAGMLAELGHDQEGKAEALLRCMAEYIEAWREMLVPGKSEEVKEQRAERTMIRVLNKFVDEVPGGGV
jgi:hypothetical protein